MLFLFRCYTCLPTGIQEFKSNLRDLHPEVVGAGAPQDLPSTRTGAQDDLSSQETYFKLPTSVFPQPWATQPDPIHAACVT